LFADDITLIVEAESYEELQRIKNSDLQLIKNWLNSNKLILNENKSHFMLMGRPRSDVSINIEIDGKRLERVYESKILGVIIDHDLRFESHINKLCKTTSIRISFLTRLKHFVPKHSLKTIFNALIQPHLDYGNIVWVHTYDIHTNRS
jgi:hypothetical protein